MKKTLTFLLLTLSLSVSNAQTPVPVSTETLPDVVTFNAHIRPIFSDTCFACHGFDSTTRKAGLRLDTQAGAYANLKDSADFAIVPGKPEISAVVQRILTTDEEDVMPPKDFHKELTPTQKALIQKWVAQGAVYEEHWAFAPIKRSEVPPTIHQALVANPVDSFIFKRLEDNNLTPSPIADKATLLRRLSFDLIGLPPTPEDLAAFLADNSPEAYIKQVDRLLASPHFGERMAVPWLDVVRFADTVGYHGDQNVNIAPYRDYVIKSFNDNKPFNQFTLEQIAGDLLPSPTDEQRIATGFLRLNLMTREGGAQSKEYLAKSLGDRVRAIGAAWLGLTTGCAECHDHKFDPFTAKDYYALGAFFGDVTQWGLYDNFGGLTPELAAFNINSPFPPELFTKNTPTQTHLAQLRIQATTLLTEANPTPNETERTTWLTGASTFLTQNPTGWVPIPATNVETKGAQHTINPDNSVTFSGAPNPAENKIKVTFQLPNLPIRAIRIEVLPDPVNGDNVGRSPDGKFYATPSFLADTTPITIAWSQADRRTPGGHNNGTCSPLLEAAWASAPAPWEEPHDAAKLPHNAIYHLAETLPATPNRTLTLNIESADIGKIRLSVTPFGAAVPGETNALTPTALQALTTPNGDPKEITAAWMLSTVPEANLPDPYKKLLTSIQACRAGYAYSLISKPFPAERVLKTHILPRGNWMTPAEEVVAAVPAFLPHQTAPDGQRPLTRIDLANWLTADENPLVARHFVNRLWKQFFGRGLSNILDDIGNQGEWPSNQPLLDWLAAEFRESGWDVKRMVKGIVCSHTYRQVSASSKELEMKDPANRLLSEQSPRRLDAEFVRDNALAISGLLQYSLIGGPSVKPYQPEGYYANLNYPERGYDHSLGADQYRRGLYTHWQRTFMHPMLAAFDAPSRESCAADRLMSNTPQQALSLLNDPSFVEASRAFAIRIIRENPQGADADKLKRAILLALSRDAKPEEIDSLTKFLQVQRDYFKTNPNDAQPFLTIGPSDPGIGLDPADLAAWSQVCRVILNLHETITRY